MMEIDERMERILPELKKRTDLQIEKFKKLITPDIFGEIPEEESEKIRTVLPISFRPFLTMHELESVAKEGVNNILKSMGYNPEIDRIIKGYSGNEYRIALVAQTPNRLLIVDQMVLFP